MNEPTATVTPAAPEADEDAGLSIYDIYETNAASEEEGRWFNDYFRPLGKGDIKLRSYTSDTSKAMHRQLSVKYAKHLDDRGEYPKAITRRMGIEHLANAIIVDWRGPVFRDKANNSLPCTPENAIHLLMRLPHLADRLSGTGTSLEAFRMAAADATEKN